MTSWRKSSHSSSGQEGGCVEVAPVRGTIAIRDSKDPQGPRLTVTPTTWRTLLANLRNATRLP